MKLNFYLRGLGIGMVVTALVMGIGNKQATLTDAQIKERAAALGMIDESEYVLAENKSLDAAKNDIETPAMLVSDDKDDISFEEKAAQAAEAIKNDTDPAISDATMTEKTQPETEKNDDNKLVASSIEDDGQNPEKKADKSTNAAVDKKDTASTSTAVEKKDTASTSTAVDKKDIAVADAEKKKTSTAAAVEKKDTASTSTAVDISEPEEKLPQISTGDGFVTITVTGGQSSTAVAKACEAAGVVSDAAAFDRFLCDGGYDRRITTGKKNIPTGASMVEVAGILTVR